MHNIRALDNRYKQSIREAHVMVCTCVPLYAVSRPQREQGGRSLAGSVLTLGDVCAEMDK